jgi:MFS superfamily sulfate permease-like transporter
MVDDAWHDGPTPRIAVIASIAVVLALLRSRVLPAALMLFAGGLTLALWADTPARDALRLGWSWPRWTPPGWHDFVVAAPTMALPQIPLTTLNSVIAVCALSATLFPGRAASTRDVATSVGIMNLVGCWFGAMPMCHGAGGLAAQYRFGARTNGALLVLGSAKVALAVLFGASLLPLCAAFPSGVLGVMLAVSGVELSLAARQTGGWRTWAPTLTTAAIALWAGMAAGFAAGLCVAWSVRAERSRHVAPP